MDILQKYSVTTEWIKVNELKSACFVGHEAIAFSLGSHILFTNLTTGLDSYYRADLINSGDGVSCLAGHKVFSIFAFSESCWNSRIFIVSYPEFSKISILESKEESIYISLAFSETEHLIALTGMPSYKIQVWYWRTQDLLISKETKIITDKQRITCSSSLPLTVSQLAYKKGQLTVWEVHGTQKFCKLIKRKIKLNFSKADGPFEDAYSIEGNIQIVNKHGDIYNVIPSSGSINLIAKWNLDKVGNTTNNTDLCRNACIAYFKGGILISGPDGSLKYFKKQKYVWNAVFQLPVPKPFTFLKGYQENEVVIGTTTDGSLFKIIMDGDRVNFSKIKDYDRSYVSFVLLYPFGTHLVVVDSFNIISVLSIKTGLKVSKIDISESTIIRSNPLYPFIAIGNVSGDIFIVSLVNPEHPEILTEFHLSHNAITNLQFSDAGNYLFVIDMEMNIFIIKGIPGGKMEIIEHLKEDLQIVDFFVTETKDVFNVFVLQKFQEHPSLGGNSLVKIMNLSDGSIERLVYHLPAHYTSILPVIGSDTTFYGTRYLARNIELLEIEDDTVFLSGIIETPHQLKHIEGYNNKHKLITWSMDGITAIYDAQKGNSLEAAFVAHNRHNLGVKRACCDPNGEFVVTLGQSGNLVCSRLANKKSPEEQQQLKDEILQSEKMIQEMFSHPTTGGFISTKKEYSGKKFIDLKNEQTYKMEANESKETRSLLFSQLKKLKEHIKHLLDENEANPEVEEKLEIQDFNLDLITTSQKEQQAKKERDQEEKRMLDYIEAQTQMNNWIIERCWKPIEVKGAKLRGMFIRFFVDNFPLMPERKNDNGMKAIQFMRSIENSVAREDVFLPWRPISSMELEKILTKEPTMFELDTEDHSQFRKIMYTLMGTNTHKFIEVSPLHYQQLDVISFHQMKIEKYLIDREVNILKKNFNRKFDAMHKTKSFQIDSIKIKNNRLRHIQNEMKELDELKGIAADSAIEILDPDFRSDEIPLSIVKVDDSEICVAPYISPSYQKLLEAEEAAREKRRLELEADDFRDRALDMMMDGVLEHRWEDEIKKNPKTPECIVKNKERDDYTENDLRDVYEYDQAYLLIVMEREKYRRMLYDEQKLLQSMLDDEIRKFNYSLSEMALEKMKIDVTITQEDMKLLMMTQYNFRRISYQKEEIDLHHKTEYVKSLIENLGGIQTELQERISEIKNNYTNLVEKDKTLEKQFKANFSEAAPGAPVDQAFKYFKRRPKLQMRAQITSPILLEVAKRMGSKKMSYQIKLLPTECIEYINGVDLLDQVASSTTGIDQNSWQTLCKMRRIKIESEFKIKSLGLQLADAEATLTAYVKEMNTKRNYLQSIERSLVELKENRETDAINRYVQIVMKRGIIEIPLSGAFSDFNDSILIHRSDIDDINKIIKKAGLKKLRALSNAAMFRRKITMKEWEHKVLKLKVRDLKEFVKTIEKCKITKEVQLWLKRKERGWAEDLGESALNREIENSINSQEKVLNDFVKEVSLLNARIDNKHKEIKLLDKQIQLLNIDVSEQHFMRDVEFEKDEFKTAKERMSIIIERAKIVRQIQHQHAHILELSTLLELQRLKTYPTLTAAQSIKSKNII